jgi:hypothetical protein
MTTARKRGLRRRRRNRRRRAQVARVVDLQRTNTGQTGHGHLTGAAYKEHQVGIGARRCRYPAHPRRATTAGAGTLTASALVAPSASLVDLEPLWDDTEKPWVLVAVDDDLRLIDPQWLESRELAEAAGAALADARPDITWWMVVNIAKAKRKYHRPLITDEQIHAMRRERESGNASWRAHRLKHEPNPKTTTNNTP